MKGKKLPGILVGVLSLTAVLLAQAPVKYALIKGSEVAGTFDSENEAVGAGYRRYGNEPFLVKHIVEADLPLTFATFNLGA